jgi:hypothetical protein
VGSNHDERRGHVGSFVVSGISVTCWQPLPGSRMSAEHLRPTPTIVSRRREDMTRGKCKREEKGYLRGTAVTTSVFACRRSRRARCLIAAPPARPPGQC